VSDPHPDADLGLAAARVDRAAADRRSERTERLILSEEISFSAVLHDVAGSGDRVVIEMTSGNRHAGCVTGIGEDFLLMESTRREPVALRRASVVALIREAPGSRPDSPVASTQLDDLLVELAASGAKVRIVVQGGSTTTGVIREIGTDVVQVRDGSNGRSVYLTLAAIAEVSSISMTSSS